ncbi:MAG: hypothetical protein P1V97_37725 [Planctomycetota bacterium]|nr:hypothetical protein [Planctomycetota bacterium]
MALKALKIAAIDQHGLPHQDLVLQDPVLGLQTEDQTIVAAADLGEAGEALQTRQTLNLRTTIAEAVGDAEIGTNADREASGANEEKDETETNGEKGEIEAIEHRDKAEIPHRVQATQAASAEVVADAVKEETKDRDKAEILLAVLPTSVPATLAEEIGIIAVAAHPLIGDDRAGCTFPEMNKPPLFAFQ